MKVKEETTEEEKKVKIRFKAITMTCYNDGEKKVDFRERKPEEIEEKTLPEEWTKEVPESKAKQLLADYPKDFEVVK